MVYPPKEPASRKTPGSRPLWAALAFVCLAAGVMGGMKPAAAAPAAPAELTMVSIALASQPLPRRKPGDEDPVMPQPKPEPAAEEEAAPPEPPKDEEAERAAREAEAAKREAEKQEFAWDRNTDGIKTSTPTWVKIVLIVLASAIFATAAFLSVWVLRWRSFALLVFAATAWIFEFHILGFRLSPAFLSSLNDPLVPIAFLGLGGAVMFAATVGPHLPRLYRQIMGFGFGGFFLGLILISTLVARLDPVLAKAALAVSVPFVLYAQVLTWGRGLGRAFTLGLLCLMVATVAAALAPLFVNVGQGAPIPIWLHLLFLSGLALAIVPSRVSTDFAEDFYHSGSFRDETFAAPEGFGRFGERDDFNQRFRENEPRFGGWDDEPEEDWEDDETWLRQETYDEREEVWPEDDPVEDDGDWVEDDDDWQDERDLRPGARWQDDDPSDHDTSHRGGRNDYEEIARSGDRSQWSAPVPPRRNPVVAPAPLGRPAKAGLTDENRYALGIAGAHQGLWDWTIDRDELYLSPSVDGMLGLAAGGLKRSEVGWAERVHPDDFHAYRDALRTYISRGNSAFELEFRMRHESGDYVWMKLRATCLPDEDGIAARVVGTVADITQARTDLDRYSQSSDHDPLTGLTNRAAFSRQVERLLTSAVSPDQMPALIVIDLDRFKTVNDSLGQSSGDALLQTVARRLEDVTGGAGLVSRLGSDEFAILVHRTPGVRPGVIAAKALDALAQPVELDGHEVFPMASLGLAEAAPHHRKAEDLLKDAETAMFRAKRQGGGTVEVYESSMSHQTMEALALETDLRRALERQQMEVMFQPIMDLRTNSVAGFEALLRWRHPVHGLMTPDQFVSIAETTDMIVPLGRFVLSMASLQLSQWQRLFPVNPPLFVSVNVSSRQLKRVDFSDDVREVLETARILPGTLKLEVTESLIQEDPILAENLLNEVRALGAGVVLDDFGTGFASLANLQRYPFDTIKVDRSFVSTMDTRADSHVIVNSIVTLAGDLGLTVVAEGLESDHDRHRLWQMGCNYGQGFVFGPPMNALDAQTFIANHWSAD